MTNAALRGKPDAGNSHVAPSHCYMHRRGEAADGTLPKATLRVRKRVRGTSKLTAASSILSAAAAILASPSTAMADSDLFSVPAGTTYTVETSATHGTNDILGTLILPSGKTFGAEKNWFGRTGSAVIDIQGGAYGTEKDGASNEIVVGEEGGSASVSLSGGGSLSGGNLTIKAATPANGEGYIDFLSSSGNNTLKVSVRKNAASAPVRIRVLSGTLTDAANIGYWTTRYQSSGSWVFDVSEGAKVTFDHGYKCGNFNAANVPVTVRGDGTASFTAPGSTYIWPVSSGAVFDNAGGIECSGASVSFGDGVVFGDSFGGITTSVEVKFGGNVNMGDLTATGTGSVKANGSATPTITFGTANRDATLTGTVFADDSCVSLVKTGTGTLTASATTQYLPETTVNGGEVVIKGALTCTNLTLAAGTGVTVDGGVWTIEGAQLTQAAGSTINTINGGKIIVKTVGGSAPTFASGSTIDVYEYWIDGVKQANGTYTLGDATLDVYSFVEPDIIWTNEGKPGAVHTFGAGEEYKGFELVKSSAPLAFAGELVVLGSSGIAVENTADAVTFGFDVPLLPPVDQTWAFGAASAVFSKPFTKRGSEAGGRVTITSDADIVLATTNSTFKGSFDITARSITLSGSHPLGTGTATSSLKIDYNVGDAAKIILRDVDLTQNVSIDIGGTNLRKYMLFEGENWLQGVNFNSDKTRGGSFAADSETVFNGNVAFYNYNTWSLGRNARAVFKAPVTLSGWAGSPMRTKVKWVKSLWRFPHSVPKCLIYVALLFAVKAAKPACIL